MSESGNVARSSAALGFHDKMTWPVIAGLAVVILVAVVTAVLSAAPAMADGCSDAIKGNVAEGEIRLNNGQLQDAADIGKQAIDAAHDCKCAHQLLARTAMARLHIDLTAHDLKKARADMLECYAEAQKTTGIGGTPTPEVKALIKGCSIASSARTPS